MDQILHQVVGSQMMPILYGFSSYNHIRVNKVDTYKTTFTTRWGTLSYERITFGLVNTSATFQRVMQLEFKYLIGKIIQIYLNDLTIYLKFRIHHFKHLR